MIIPHLPPSRLLTINASQPFLPTLAQALLSGTFWPELSGERAGTFLAQSLILVPNRRAARVLKESLLRVCQHKALLLPRIETLGDIDQQDDDQFVPESFLPDREPLPKVVDPLVQLHSLVQLVARWQESQQEEMVPDSVESFALAADLATLLDRADNYDVDWRKLDQFDDSALSDHWRKVRDFLNIVTQFWPDYLDASNLVSAGTRRRLAMERLAALWEVKPPQTPVFIAGSLGSQPATRRLMKALTTLPYGFIILPNFDPLAFVAGQGELRDRQIKTDDPGWQQHPQFSLHQLVKALRVGIDEVRPLGVVLSEGALARQVLIREALRPSDETAAWEQLDQRLSERERHEAIAGLTMIRADNPHEEALALAIALRRVLETGGKNALLITPDRRLAQRVAGELIRFGIEIDDSAGQSLDQSLLAQLCLDLIDLVSRPLDPHALLAFLDHPLLALPLEKGQRHQGREAIECALFRASPPVSSWEQVEEVWALRRQRAMGQMERDDDPLLWRLSDKDWQDGQDVLDGLMPLIHPLIQALADAGLTALGDSAELIGEAFGRLIDRPSLLAEGYRDVLKAIEDRLASFSSPQVSHLRLAPRRFSYLLRSLFKGHSLRPVAYGRAEPRLAILGPLEARLQQADVMVLGGMVDGTWPVAGRSDPWLTRGMRAALGFEEPEIRLGLAAHDWQSFMAGSEVIVSYSAMTDGKPTVASRWLQRLNAVAGDEIGEAWARGERLLSWARRLDQPESVNPWPRPEPCLKADQRPERITITEVERLLGNPYGFYARHSLGLQALAPVASRPGIREQGIAVHRAFETYVALRGEISAQDERSGSERLIGLYQDQLNKLPVDSLTRWQWMSRFERLAPWFVAWDRKAGAGAQSLVEVRAKLDILLPSGRQVTLSGQIDRLDWLRDGQIRVYDYKTGTLPDAKQIREGLAPQLYLGAALMLRGTIISSEEDRSGLPDLLSVDGLAYLHVKGESPPFNPVPLGLLEDKPDLTASADFMLERLIDLLSGFEDDKKPYLPVSGKLFASQRYDDYAHLARFSEWHASAGFDGDEPSG